MFLTRHDARLCTRGSYSAPAAVAEAAGIEVRRNAEFTPHVLRHTIGTTGTRAGTNITLVADTGTPTSAAVPPAACP
ncbi:MAG: hypothetical protein M0Z42_14705 [Actinomycetota bacterium]|nr:hypothetical protein [Actinomycetota bacterium]